jgi:hypothetical protein
MVVKNLEFFDKDGYNLNLNWNADKHIWEGNIFFPRVSVGLYENTTIYVVEYKGQQDNDYTDDEYTYPMGEGSIAFQWDLANSFVDEFFMFDFDEDYELKDTSALIHTPYDGPLCETLIINRFDKYIAPLLGSAQNIEQDDLLEIHVAFMADENSAETTYKRTLVMSYENGYTKYEIARITFFAETIEEDERLKIWNENLGYNLKPEDTMIFKHSDIHEYMPDFEILNEKRKELMLEGHNIYPYIGSYKAILNAIKFFGYDNLNIVEYWRNINEYDSEFGKIYRTYVYTIKDRKTLSTKRKPISLNTKDFQKLSNISLVYNVNHPEKVEGKKYDEYGLPNVIEDFDKDKRDDFILTIEEALIKLFALKKKLNNEFMPGSTKITDIIGEGNYFGINLIGNNPQISTVNYIESKGYVDFTVFPNKYCYITENEDFARYIAEKKEKHVDETLGGLKDKTIEEISKFYADSDSDSDAINEIDTRSLDKIISEEKNDFVCDIYEEYYNITYDNKFGDAAEYGLREMPEPRNVYRDIVDDIISEPFGSEIDDEVVPDMFICAKVILKGDFSENIDGTSTIKWRIIYTTDPNKEKKEWEYYGDVKTFGNVFVQLPYLGNYDVEMTVWDVYNHCCKQYTTDAIIVKPYNIDIRGFYYDARPLPDGLKYELMIPQEYLDNVEKEYRYYLWGNTTKGIVTYKRNPLEISLSDIVGEYIDGNFSDINREDWVSIVNSESDGDNILKISWVRNYQNDVSYGVDEFDFNNELINASFDENDSYSSEWNKDELYHVIKKNVDNMYHWALQEHLGGKDKNSTMRNYRPDGSVSFEGPYYKYDVDNILYKIEKGYKEYDHLNEEIINLRPGKHYKYVRYINSVVDIKPLTWILLGFDYTRITGRMINDEYPKWTLTMIGDELDPDEDLRNDKEITTHNGLYFTYLFEEEGIYKIKLEILDINGNKYVIEKPIVIVDKDANYEMYHTLKDEYDKYLEAKSERSLAYLT